MLFLIDQQFKQAVFQFSKESILLATSLYKPLLMKNKCKNGIYVKENISIWRYFHNKRVFCYKVFSVLIICEGLSFGDFSFKIEPVVFVYELITYL